MVAYPLPDAVAVIAVTVLPPIVTLNTAPLPVPLVADCVNPVKVPLAAGETMGAASNYLPFLQNGLIDYMMFDPVWIGGITESLKAATLADAHQIPISIHDCNGPVNFTVGVNLSLAITNACTYETARGFYYGWYHELLEEVPLIDNGFVTSLNGDGLGIKLKEKWLDKANSTIIETKN